MSDDADSERIGPTESSSQRFLQENVIVALVNICGDDVNIFFMFGPLLIASE